MFKSKDCQSATKENGLIIRCDQIIIASLYIIIIAVPLFFGINLHSVFDLSKITILYVLIFTILAIWSIKTLIYYWEKGKRIGNVHEDSEKRRKGGLTRPFGIYNVPFNQAQPLNLPIVAFLLITGLATIFSVDTYTSLVGTYKRYDGFLSTIVYVCLFYAVVNFIEKKRLNSFINIIILTACIASIVGLLQQFEFDPYQWNVPDVYSESYRIFSTFGHPAFFSAFLIMVIPLVLVKIFSPLSLANSGQNYIQRLKPYFFLSILASLTVTLYYTRTRACFLGFIVSNLFFFSFIGKKNLLAGKTKTIITLTILIGISVFYNLSDKTSVIVRFVRDIQPALLDSEPQEETDVQQDKGLTQQNLLSSSGFGVRDDSIAYRLEGTMFMRVIQYITGLRIIYDYPILGIGPDTLGTVYPQYVAKAYEGMDEYKRFKNQNRIHSDFLDMGVSRGLLGLGVYLWFIFAYFRMVWQGYKKAEGLDKILIIGLCSGCLGYFIQNQFSFGHIPIITLFWFLIGMSVIVNPVGFSLINKTENLSNDETILTRHVNSRHNVDRFIKFTIHVAIVCLMVLLIILSLFRYIADIHFDNGRKLLNKNLIIDAIYNYEMAVRYNPSEINYRNVLNGIYLKMGVIGVNKDKDGIGEEMPELFTKEQISLWFTKAIAGSKEVQRLYPRDYRSAFLLGQAFHFLSNVSDNKDLRKEALKYYQKVKGLHPLKYQLHAKLAQFYSEEGSYQEAIQELEEAIRIAPHRFESYINLAEIFIKHRRYKDARKLYNRVIELTGSPNNKHTQYAKKKLETLPLPSKVK